MAENITVDQIIDKRRIMAIPGPASTVPGPQGLPGVNAVPADQAVAAYLTGPESASHELFATKLDASVAEATYGRRTNLVYFASSYPGMNIAGVLDAVKTDVGLKPGSQAAILVWDQPAGDLSASDRALVVNNGIQLRSVGFHASMAGAITYSGTGDYFLDFDGGDALHGGSLFAGTETSGFNLQGTARRALMRLRGADQFRISRLFFQNSTGGAMEIVKCQDFIIRDIDLDAGSLGSSSMPVYRVTDCNNAWFNYSRAERPRGVIYDAAYSTMRVFQGKVDNNTAKSGFPHVLLKDASATFDRFLDVAFSSTPFKLLGQSSLTLSGCSLAQGSAPSAIMLRYPRVSYNDRDGYHGRTPYHRFYPMIRVEDCMINAANDWDLSASGLGALLDVKTPCPVADLRQEQHDPSQAFYAPGMGLAVSGVYNDGDRVHATLSASSDGGVTWNTGLFGDSTYNNMFLGLNLVDVVTGRRGRIVNNWGSGEVRLAPVAGHSLADLATMPNRKGGYRLEWADSRRTPVFVDRCKYDGSPSLPLFRTMASSVNAVVTYDDTAMETLVRFPSASFTRSGPAYPPYAAANNAGGSLSKGDYLYAVSAVVQGSEGTLSPPSLAHVNPTDGDNGSVTLSWATVPNASSYYVYRMDQRTQDEFTRVASTSATSLVDAGQNSGETPVPPSNCPTGYLLSDGSNLWLVEHNNIDTLYVAGNIKDNADTAYMATINPASVSIQCGALSGGSGLTKII